MMIAIQYNNIHDNCGFIKNVFGKIEEMCKLFQLFDTIKVSSVTFGNF